jgi:hypothetical protein
MTANPISRVDLAGIAIARMAQLGEENKDLWNQETRI